MTLSEKAESFFRGLGGSLYAGPLAPSFLSFVFSVAASVVLNVATREHCPNSLYVYTVGIIIVGYLLPLYYGYVLVGPQIKSVTRTGTIYVLWLLLALGWNIAGSTALSDANSRCVRAVDYTLFLFIFAASHVFCHCCALECDAVKLR